MRSLYCSAMASPSSSPKKSKNGIYMPWSGEKVKKKKKWKKIPIFFCFGEGGRYRYSSIRFLFSQSQSQTGRKAPKYSELKTPPKYLGISFMTPTRMTYHSKTKYMAWVFMKSLFSQWLEEKAPKMLNCCQLKFFTHFSWGTNIHMGTTITNLIPATFGHWGLFLLVACFHWEKGSRKKIRTPFSISPTVSESPDQGPSKNTGVCPKKIGSRGNCPSFVGCNTV